MKRIGEYTFIGCTKLLKITIPKSVTSIGNYAFYNCTGLTEVTINSNDIISKDYTSNNNLKDIFGSQVTTYIIGDDVKGIGDYAFYNCTGIKNINIPNSVTSIGSSAFGYCTGLSRIDISDIGAWCGISFGNTSANPLYYAKCLYLNGQEVTNLTIPNSVNCIGNCVFIGFKSLTSINIPNSVTSIGSSTFSGCTSLTSIVIPNSVTAIGEYAFSGCPLK